MKNVLKKILNVNGIKVNSLRTDDEIHAVFVNVSMTKGKKSRCPICERKCPGYDSTTENKLWRSLDLGAHKFFVECDVHRIHCSEHGVLSEWVPWAYPGTNFTKQFEYQVAYLGLNVNKTEVSRTMRIDWKTVGKIISRTKHRLEPDSTIRYEGMTRIGIDETSYRKGHKYVTAVIDHDKNQVVWVGDRTGKKTLEKFMKSMTQVQRNNIQLVSADGAGWIKSCVEEWLPNSEFCIDAFHVVSWALEAMDENRKQVWRNANKAHKKEKEVNGRRSVGRPKKGQEAPNKTKVKSAKGLKYPLGKNPENLTENQRSYLETVRTEYPKLFKAYQLKEGLRLVFQQPVGNVEKDLDKWLSWACRCRIPSMVELSKKIRRHRESILNTVKHNLSNARIEAMNNKIKLLIRRSYGFRNINNMIDMIMLVCSNLSNQIKLPHQALGAKSTH